MRYNDMSGLKQKLAKNKLTVGSWITIGDPSVAEIMARSGFDWLTIDMEHSPITMHQAQQLIRVIELCGVAPLVRVAENNPVFIKTVMDAGAHGVIVPMVNSKVDAERAVSAVKYPNVGTRGVGLGRAHGYGVSFEKYKNWAAKNSVVIAQIEHIDAINNLEEILNVPGIDATMIGPYDLSGSVGYPGDFERKEVKEALAAYEKISKKAGKTMGYHVIEPDQKKLSLYISKGYAFMPVSTDALYLARKCGEVLKNSKNK